MFVVPTVIYLLFVASAVLIGREHSCHGGLEFYFGFGLLALPILLGTPFMFGAAYRILVRSLFGVLFLGLGVLVWALAFEFSDIVLMCRLF